MAGDAPPTPRALLRVELRGPESRVLARMGGAGVGLEVRLLPTPHGRQTLSSITSAPQAGQLVQEPPAPSVSV